MYTTTGSYIEKITIQSNNQSGIENISDNRAESACYNLMGMPSNGRGLVIRGGRKAFIK
jgi:hypothetical protein